MRQNLRVSLGAVVLALATLAAVIFALINFDQRTRFEVVYDGVAWLDTDHGIQASRVDRKSTRLNSSHVRISYAVFCLKKKKIKIPIDNTFSIQIGAHATNNKRTSKRCMYPPH